MGRCGELHSALGGSPLRKIREEGALRLRPTAPSSRTLPFFFGPAAEFSCPLPNSSPSSWAASPIGRPCVTPPKRWRARHRLLRRDRLRPSHAGPAGQFAKGAEAAGFKVIIAGAGGAAHLPGMTASHDVAAGVRRADRNEGAARAGFALFHRPDAGRRAGRLPRHRRGRRHQCRAARRRGPGARTTRRWRRGSPTGARRRHAVPTPDIPSEADGGASRGPAIRSEFWAAASWAGCWRWRRRSSA